MSSMYLIPYPSGLYSVLDLTLFEVGHITEFTKLNLSIHGASLLTWINFNLSMDKWLHPL